MPTGQVIEEEDGFKKDPISERASKDHFVKCRITRNRKGIRGQAMIHKYYFWISQFCDRFFIGVSFQ